MVSYYISVLMYIYVFMYRSGTCTYTWRVIHFTLFMPLKLEAAIGQGFNKYVIYKFTQIYL
jgi:hypothetical protein